MAKLILQVATGAALLLCGGTMAGGGELNRQEDEPAVRQRSSLFHVRPPRPEAKLYFGGTLVRGTGRERTFRSPALEEGKRFTYTVVAVWLENGREVTHEMHVAFWAGDDVVLDFRR